MEHLLQVFDPEKRNFLPIKPKELSKYSGLPFVVYQEFLDSYNRKKAYYRFYSPSGDELGTISGLLNVKEDVKEINRRLSAAVSAILENC
jgi:hypothetical protein